MNSIYLIWSEDITFYIVLVQSQNLINHFLKTTEKRNRLAEGEKKWEKFQPVEIAGKLRNQPICQQYSSFSSQFCENNVTDKNIYSAGHEKRLPDKGQYIPIFETMLQFGAY